MPVGRHIADPKTGQVSENIGNPGGATLRKTSQKNMFPAGWNRIFQQKIDDVAGVKLVSSTEADLSAVKDETIYLLLEK